MANLTHYVRGSTRITVNWDAVARSNRLPRDLALSGPPQSWNHNPDTGKSTRIEVKTPPWAIKDLGEIKNAIAAITSLLQKLDSAQREAEELLDLTNYLRFTRSSLQNVLYFQSYGDIRPILSSTELKTAVDGICDECGAPFSGQFKGWLTESEEHNQYAFTHDDDSKLPLSKIVGSCKRRFQSKLYTLLELFGPGAASSIPDSFGPTQQGFETDGVYGAGPDLQVLTQQLMITQDGDAESEDANFPGRKIAYLGEGIGGDVYAIEYLGTTAACKKMKGENAAEDWAQAQKEAKVWKSLRRRIPHEFQDHLHFPEHCRAEIRKEPTVEGGSSPPRIHTFLVMWPIADSNSLRHTLQDKNRPLARRLVRTLMGCLLVGLARIHAAGVWHHDMHSGNILIHEDHPLFSDFGKAHVFEPKPSRAEDVEYDYPAGCAEHGNDTDKDDVLSLGVILIDLLVYLTGNKELKRHRQPPNQKALDFSMSAKIRTKDLNDAVRATLNKMIASHSKPDYIELILQMVERDRQARPTAEDAALGWWEAMQQYVFRDHNGLISAKPLCNPVVETVEYEHEHEPMRLGSRMKSQEADNGSQLEEEEEEEEKEAYDYDGQYDSGQEYDSDIEFDPDLEYGSEGEGPGMCGTCDRWCSEKLLERGEFRLETFRMLPSLWYGGPANFINPDADDEDDEDDEDQECLDSNSQLQTEN